MNRKHVIVVASEAPSLKGGAPVRNYNLIRQLVQNGRSVTLICLTDESPAAEQARLEKALGVTAVVLKKRKLSFLRSLVESLLKGVPPYYLESRRSGLAGALTQAISRTQPAWVQLEELETYYAVAPALARLSQAGTKIALDAHNVEWQAFHQTLRSFSLPKRLIGTYLTPFLRRLEHHAARTASVVLVCSEVDEAYFKSLNPQVVVIPNGVDCAYFSGLDNVSDSPQLLFMGGTKYPPNADALKWYLSDIHPLVKAAVPDVRLTVLGGQPPEWLKSYAGEQSGIELPGLVPDVRPHLAAAEVCICPIRAGSGTRLKVLEYMGAGKAVVSTAKGAEGIQYQDGTTLRIANTTAEFAKCVVALLQDPTARTNLGTSAKQLAVREYDWNTLGDKLAKTLS